ncbi:hypothetical protein SPONN_1156 [uncultured Candidatus Thioglobus sp.]|nr:hypothetical protein SPONN_1156 [uncultured Candidatus Thioglobus sp.]
MEKMKYLIVIEETKTGFSAYSPDVDGCIATGSTKQEVENNMQEAMEFHLEGMLMEKQEIPHSHAYSNYLEIEARA